VIAESFAPDDLVDDDVLAMAASVWREFARREPRLADEFESAAGLALAHAARAYDPALGAKFSTFALCRVRGACLDARRKARSAGFRRVSRRVAHVPPVDSLAAPLGDGYELADVISSGDDPVGWEIESEDEVRRLVREIGGGRRGEVVLAVYLDASAGTFKAAGRRIGVGESRVSQMMGEIHDEARVILAREGGLA
jgi:hypothetical protein